MSTVTIQPDAAAGIDTYVEAGSPTTNFGTADPITAGNALVDDKNSIGNIKRALLRFDLSAIPSGSTVTSATLTLTNAGAAQALTFYASRITTPAWTEMGATWNVCDGAQAWSFGAADPDNSLTTQTTLANSAANAVFDVALQVADALANRGGQLDLVIRSTEDPETLSTIDFYSSDNATPANRPKLVVNYNPPAGRLLVRRGLGGGMRDLTAN